MKLHYFPLSTYSQKTLIALYEKGVEFTPEIVEMTTDAGRAAFKKIYPLVKVPVLICDDGRLIPESSIIIEYLDTHFDGGPRLIPTDAEQGRQARFMDRMSDNYVNEPFQTIFFDSRKPAAEKSPSAVAKARERLDVMYEFLDKTLEKRTWAAGDAFTIADCAAGPALAGARMVHPFDKFTNLGAYFGRVVERPSFARVLTEAKPWMAKLMG